MGIEAVYEIEAARALIADLVAERDELRAALARLVDGINDEWYPLFYGGEPMSSDERGALEQAEAALGSRR